MNCKILVQKGKDVIVPKQLLDFLEIAPGDQINFEFLDNGEVKVKKVQNFSSFLDDINKRMMEGGYFERAGLKNEDDVADFIRKLRDEKSSS